MPALDSNDIAGVLSGPPTEGYTALILVVFSADMRIEQAWRIPRDVVNDTAAVSPGESRGPGRSSNRFGLIDRLFRKLEAFNARIVAHFAKFNSDVNGHKITLPRWTPGRL